MRLFQDLLTHLRRVRVFTLSQDRISAMTSSERTTSDDLAGGILLIIILTNVRPGNTNRFEFTTTQLNLYVL